MLCFTDADNGEPDSSYSHWRAGPLLALRQGATVPLMSLCMQDQSLPRFRHDCVNTRCRARHQWRLLSPVACEPLAGFPNAAQHGQYNTFLEVSGLPYSSRRATKRGHCDNLSRRRGGQTFLTAKEHRQSHLLADTATVTADFRSSSPACHSLNCPSARHLSQPSIHGNEYEHT
jgi:hypothetical protein